MEELTTDLLRRHGLSVTGSRIKILALFLQSESALAHHDIEVKTKEKFDRVTVYRTLQTFMDKGIIHTIPTSDNSVKYALCKDNCEEGHHHDDHIHFICSRCGITSCLDKVQVPHIKLPRGYQSRQTEVVISGICKECSL
ncbi:MAG: transcriptional repressor [Chitinophagaceae bacterium]|nr:transcriptional repressor [Chitinophagaceae bacterium]MCW5925614.1 transcriptional repressor [Chitinophagaceae bacterium]